MKETLKWRNYEEIFWTFLSEAVAEFIKQFLVRFQEEPIEIYLKDFLEREYLEALEKFL